MTATVCKEKLAAKFRKLAAPLREKIEVMRRPSSQNMTPKRCREQSDRMIDAANLERTRLALLALADAWESGDVPEDLRDVKSKDAVARLVRHGRISNGYYHVASDGKYADSSPAGVAIQKLLEERSSMDDIAAMEEEKKRADLDEKLNKLRFLDIPGFFPTPANVGKILINAARLGQGLSVLEPSAGIGSIVDILPKNISVTCVELRPSLADVLRHKGYKVIEADFLGLAADPRYDRIIMNPPFERGADTSHIQAAFGFLKPGGVLVAVCSEGPFFRCDKQSENFREWLLDMVAIISPLPDGCFEGPGSFRSTGIKCRMIVIGKPAD